MFLTHLSRFSGQVLISSRDVGQACHEIWGAGPKYSPYKIHLTGALPFWAGLEPGEVQQRDCQEGKSHFSQRLWDMIQQGPGAEHCLGGARRHYPHVQMAFETFCSFAVNSRGSLRTEISARTWPGCWQRPQCPAELSLGRSCCHPCCGLCSRSPLGSWASGARAPGPASTCGSLGWAQVPAPAQGILSAPCGSAGCRYSLGVSLMGFGVSLMGFVLKGRCCVRNASSVL